MGIVGDSSAEKKDISKDSANMYFSNSLWNFKKSDCIIGHIITLSWSQRFESI